ncbi:hypothetical protein WMO24_14095 [Ruthenibacterium sp. CLA-JM-H11]|uniref:Uncharacterized protein n=1 Tax=Ruthenibacterium intestinale TaxID=3133163 RepID=A0ABV1GII4_9FIRM
MDLYGDFEKRNVNHDTELHSDEFLFSFLAARCACIPTYYTERTGRAQRARTKFFARGESLFLYTFIRYNRNNANCKGKGSAATWPMKKF